MHLVYLLSGRKAEPSGVPLEAYSAGADVVDDKPDSFMYGISLTIFVLTNMPLPRVDPRRSDPKRGKLLLCCTEATVT